MSPFDEATRNLGNPQESVPKTASTQQRTAKAAPQSEPSSLNKGANSPPPPPPQYLIHPWHVVLGDCNSRERRTTEATKVLRSIKREFLKTHFGKRKEDWIPLAIDEFYERIGGETFDNAQEEVGRVLVRCTPKSMARIEVPYQYGFKDDDEAWYGIAKQREALEFFLTSRDSPTLADELAKHQRKFAALRQAEEQPPDSMMENFRELLDYIQKLLQKAENGDRFSASILDSLSPINKMKIHWKTLNHSKGLKGATSSEPAEAKPAGNDSTRSSKKSTIGQSIQGEHTTKTVDATTLTQPTLGAALYPQLRDQAMNMGRGRCALSDDDIVDEHDPLEAVLQSLEKEIDDGDIFLCDDHLIVDGEQADAVTDPGDPSVFDLQDADISSSGNGTADQSHSDRNLTGRVRSRADTDDSEEVVERRLSKHARTARRLAVALSACATFTGVVFGVGVASASSAESDDDDKMEQTGGAQGQPGTEETLSPMDSEGDDEWAIPILLSLYLCFACVLILCFVAIPYWCIARYCLRRRRQPSDDEDINAVASSGDDAKKRIQTDDNV